MKKLYLVLIVAFVVRVLWLPENIFFGYEQGRDFLKLSEITSGNLTLIGPKTDIEGLFHGAFSYYSLLPSFVIFGGNPLLVLLSLISVHIVSIFFLYKLAVSFRNKKFGLLVAVLYAISYSSVVYVRWLSNPNLVPALAIFFLYFLKQAEKKKSLLILAALFWALIFHLQVVAALILCLPAVYFVVAKKVLTKKNIVLSGLVIVGILSTYLIFNFRNDNILLTGFVDYITGEQSPVGQVRLDEFNNEIVDNLLPPHREIAFALIWLVVILNIFAAWRDFTSRYILILFFAAPTVFVLLGVTPLRHLFILIPLFTSLLVANALNYLIERKYVPVSALILVAILMGNLITIFSRLPESNRNFIYHAQSTYLADMKNLIDFAYRDSGESAFSYDYYSVPYWHKDAWEYLFSWYGKWKYKTLPSDRRTKVFYVFIEPDETQPKYQEDWYKTLTKTSMLLAEQRSGKLKVEKREDK